MKKLFSQRAEMTMVRTICADEIPEKHRAAFLGKLDPSFFNHPVARKAFKRVATLTSKKQTVPVWDDLLDDPSFDSEAREFLSETEVLPVMTKKKVHSLIEKLDNWRKLRELWELGTAVVSYYDTRDELDPDELADELATRLARARKNFSKEQKIWTFGKGSNAKELTKMALYKPKESMFKTGFAEYDKRNGGLPTTGVLLLAGTTSGGKSVLANNLLRNLATLNAGVSGVKVTLEMTAEQETNRVMSMISGVPFWKIKQQKLSEIEKRKIMRAMGKFDKQLRKLKSRFSYVSPEGGMTIDDVINMIKPYGYNIVVLDYISLLEGVDDDNQWRMLSAIARKAKVYATESKTLFVILCQLDSKTNQLRYSQGVKEHCDVMMAWNYTDEEQRALKILPIDIAKARDGELFRLELQDQFEVMRVTDPPNIADKLKGATGSSRTNGPETSDSSEDGGYIMS